jgi:SAM-dependent methyltransferase
MAKKGDAAPARTPAAPRLGALGRAAKLVDPAYSPVVRDGYLDVMGDRGVQRSIVQRAMQSTLLPTVYERAWRPLAFGVASLGLRERDEANLMRTLLDLTRGNTVLDVACGPGNTIRRLVDDVGDSGLLVGVDAAPAMLARAVADTEASNVAYVRADGAALPFPDGTFDAVSCFGALYLVDEPYAVLAELIRVLAPGGRLAVLTSCHRAPGPLGPVVKLAGLPSGFRWFGPHDITGALDDHGLGEIDQTIRGVVQYVGATKPG